MAINNQQQQNRRPTANPLEYQAGSKGASMIGAAADESTGPEVEVLSTSEAEALERVQLDVQIATAKRWARPGPQKIIEQMVQYATLDEETAVSCFYTLEREQDGEAKKVTGPSIRLAEIAVMCFKNVRAGARVIGNNGRVLQSQGFCFDLENNVAVTITADRQIATRYFENGKEKYRTWSLDMQQTTGNAANSISYRNSVFKVIPAILIKPVLQRCMSIAAGEGPIDARFQKACRMFAPWGVTDAMLKTWLKKPDTAAAEMVDEDIVNLRGLFTALRDGEQTVQEVFGGMNKDGSRKEAAKESHEEKPAAQSGASGPQKQQPEQKTAESAAAGDQATTTERGAPANKRGSLTEADFTEDEWKTLQEGFTRAGLGKNKAQLVVALSRWPHTKGEFLGWIQKNIAEKEKGEEKHE